MRLLDEQYTRTPFYGSGRMTEWLSKFARCIGGTVRLRREHRHHYIRLTLGFLLYLVAVMDWFSRYVLSWRLSASLHQDFCLEALRPALSKGQPRVCNSYQGRQFTSEIFTGELAARKIAISIDGRGRCLDNIFIKRLWRSLKYEGAYIKD